VCLQNEGRNLSYLNHCGRHAGPGIAVGWRWLLSGLQREWSGWRRYDAAGCNTYSFAPRMEMSLPSLVPCGAGAVPRRTCDAVLGAGLGAGCWMLAIGAGYRRCGVSKPQFSGWPCRCRRRWRGLWCGWLCSLLPVLALHCWVGRGRGWAWACACWASDTIEDSKVRRGCGCGGTSLDNSVSQKPVSGIAFVLLLRRWHDSARAEPSAQSTIAR
jgi:hypothetical protein